jgi:hypothetical protein
MIMKFANGFKITFLNGVLDEDVYMVQLMVLSILKGLGRYASLRDPFMDYNKYLRVGT